MGDPWFSRLHGPVRCRKGKRIASCRAGEGPEWQGELTVNQPSYDFVGSSPTSPTNQINDLIDLCFPPDPCSPKLGSTWKEQHLAVSGYFPPPCCRPAGLQYAFRHEESGSQHDFGCC